MPQKGSKSITIKQEIWEAIDELAPYLGFYGEGPRPRVIAHLVKLAQERPDFFHVANRKRKWPPIDKRYAQK